MEKDTMTIFEKIFIPFTKVYFDNKDIAELDYSNIRKNDSYEYANIVIKLSNKFRLTNIAKSITRAQKVALKANKPISFDYLKLYADILQRWVNENYKNDAIKFVNNYLTIN